MNPAPLHAAILRAASLLVPVWQRDEWLAEWRAELCYVCRHGGKGTTAFCLGAIPDALWLRRNSLDTTIDTAAGTAGWKMLPLDSPVSCIVFLGLLAATSLFVAMHSPGPRELIVPYPHRDADNLVMISAAGHYAIHIPTVPDAAYQALANRNGLFAATAFYRPIRARVSTRHGGTAELSVGLADRNLLRIMHRTPPPVTPALLLHQTAWLKHFDGDPRIVGRVVVVAGRSIAVAGVIPVDGWRLPGRVDAWLIEDEQRVDAPLQAPGFVVAERKTPRPWWNFRWRISVPNGQGGYHHYDCASLSRRPLLYAHLLVFVLALLILPATTSLALGEYPANRHSPPFAKRLRRWVFLAVKVALVIVIVFCGVLDLATITSTKIQPQGLMVGYVLALRWALADQRKRCPVCLRTLTNPTRIGWISRTFLDWHGTEFICTRGHGLLHVPEISSSSYGTQRWLYLDQSWAGLFTTRKG